MKNKEPSVVEAVKPESEERECQTDIGAEFFEKKSSHSSKRDAKSLSEKNIIDTSNNNLNANSSTALGSNAMHGQSLMIDTSKEEGLHHNTSIEMPQNSPGMKSKRSSPKPIPEEEDESPDPLYQEQDEMSRGQLGNMMSGKGLKSEGMEDL